MSFLEDLVKGLCADKSNAWTDLTAFKSKYNTWPVLRCHLRS